MKKFGIIALAALLVVAFTVPASALENVFGGYWRTRAYSALDYDGNEYVNGGDLTRVDTRTRLYYTAILNDNLKLVTKFEIDYVWGDNVTGDIGADGLGQIEVKNIYADFNMGPVNAKVGTQYAVLGRGILFADDFSGVLLTYKGEGFSIPLMWAKAWEGNAWNSSDDTDYYGILPSFSLGEGITLNPFLVYATSNAAGAGIHANMAADANDLPWGATAAGDPTSMLGFDELQAWYYGIEANMKFGPASIFVAGLLQGGDIRNVAGAAPIDFDFEGASINLGGSFDFGMFDVHGEWLWISGEDVSVGDPTGLVDREIDGWYVPEGMSVFYGEIISGNGSFDVAAATGSPGASWTVGEAGVNAFNLGSKVKPMDKLTVALDIWYVLLDEERAVVNATTGVTTYEDELGTEVDLKVTYELVEGLNLDVIGGYLFTGDGVYTGNNDENATLLGAQLSMSF